MRTPLGPKRIPYTYVDPLGQVPPNARVRVHLWAKLKTTVALVHLFSVVNKTVRDGESRGLPQACGRFRMLGI